MNDQTQVPAGETPAEAPAAPVAKYGKPTFGALPDRNRVFTLEPLDATKAARNVELTYGVNTQVDENNVSPDKQRAVWQAGVTFTFDGSEATVVAQHATPRGAVKAVLGQLPGSVSIEMYAELNYEDEFFTAKWEAPKPTEPKVKFGTMVSFEGHEVSLADLRGTMEDTLTDISASESNTQAAAIRLGKALNVVYKSPAVKEDNAKLTSFVRGEGLGDNATGMPHLARLGSGQNAVVEALRFGQADDRLLAVLNSRTSSGKGFDRLKSVTTKEMVNAAVKRFYEAARNEDITDLLPVAYTSNDKVLSGFNSENAALFLRCLLEVKEGFGIATAQNEEWYVLQERADAAADKLSVEFLGMGGKDFNPYNEREFALSKTAFVRSLHAYVGSDLPGAHGVAIAIDQINRLFVAETAGEAKAIESCMNVMHGSRSGLLLAAGAAEIRKDLEAADAESKRKEVTEQVGEEQMVNEKMRKAFASLSVIEAAAKLFNLVTTHAEWKAIVAELGVMAKTKAAEDAAKPKTPATPVEGDNTDH